VSALNAVIDSVSLAGVTPSSGGIASYGDVAPGTADCATTRTWPFTDPTDADFSFQGHAEGTVTVASCAQVLAANPAAPSGLQHRARRHVDQRVLRHDRSGRRVDRGPRPGRQRRVRLRKQGELGRAAQHRVAERRTVFDRELARCDPQRDELHFPQSVPPPQYLQYPLLNTYSTLSSIPTVPSPQYLQYPLLNTYEQWTQVEDPRTLNNTLPTLVGSVVESPAGQTGGCASSPWSGILSSQSAYLSADATRSCRFFAIGTNGEWNGGIPANNQPTSHVTLCVK
jgi:hypothetical protein